MRATFFSTILAAALLMSSGAYAADTAQFSNVVDDLPMMDAMVEVGDGVAFATPTGRIAYVLATVTASQKEVLAFYKATLPQLGWTQTAEGSFVREGETLNVTFEEGSEKLMVRFAIAPTNQ